MSDKKQEIVSLLKEALKIEKITLEQRRDYCSKLLKIIEASDKYKSLVTFRDIDEKLSDARYALKSKIDDEKEIEKYVTRNFLTKRTFTFYYPFYYTYNFPDNYQIGFCKSIHFCNIPNVVQSDLEVHWKHEFTINNELFRSKEEYVKNRKEALFLKLEVEASGQNKAIESAKGVVERSLDILRMIYYIGDIIPIEYCFTVSDIPNWSGMGGYFFGYNPNLPGSKSYDPRMDSRIKEMTLLVTAKDLKETEVRLKLRNAMRMYGAASSARYNEVKYIVLISALEAMILVRSDIGNMSTKFAERIVFLISKPEDRKKHYYLLLKFYDKRSRIIHGDSKQEVKVQDYEIDQLSNIVQSVFWKLIDLLNKEGCLLFEKSGDPKMKDVPYIIDHIDKLKFQSP